MSFYCVTAGLERLVESFVRGLATMATTVRTINTTLRWQVWRQFRYTQSNATRNRHPKFKDDLIEVVMRGYMDGYRLLCPASVSPLV